MSDVYREALEAVREALDIPHAATVGNDEVRAKILDERLTHAVLFLRRILDDDPNTDIPWHVTYLRERLAEHPPCGYVTGEHAHALLARGVPYPDAVAVPSKENHR